MGERSGVAVHAVATGSGAELSDKAAILIEACVAPRRGRSMHQSEWQLQAVMMDRRPARSAGGTMRPRSQALRWPTATAQKRAACLPLLASRRACTAAPCSQHA